MEFYFAGGAMEVGASCVYVRIAGYGILMDSGIRQGSGSADPLPDFSGIQDAGGVDVILVSHAHMDHTGSLPVISGAYPKAKIYMTPMTMDLTRVLLYDSLKLMNMNEEEIPKYSENEVILMFSRVCPVKYQVTTEILPGISITMYPAGHIAGAACIYLTTPEGSILYTGDVSGFAQQTIEGLALPKLRPDVAIMESTYGNRLHSVRSIEENRLVTLLQEYMLQGKKVLIPAFALGRSQEVLLILRRAFLNKQLMEVPVYVDGMVRDMNRVYTMHPDCLKRSLARRILKGDEPFYNDKILAVGPRDNRRELLEKEGPAIFVASSGMLSGGPSVEYAKHLLPTENAAVILTGYQDEESPGRMLLNLLEEGEEKSVTMDGIKVNVKAKVAMVGLSAHSDSSELSGIIEKTTPRHVILVHGNQESIEALGGVLSGDFRRRVYQPMDGERLLIELHSKRTQQKAQLVPIGKHDSFDPERDGEKLYDYWNRMYPKRSFIIEEVATLWFGSEQEDEVLSAFLNDLLSSPYFDRHPRRMHLLRTCTVEEIKDKQKELEKKSLPSSQTVEQFLREALSDLPIKRYGVYMDKREISLTVDFPDAFPMERLEEVNAQSQELYGWSVTLKPSTNYTAASGLIRELFAGRVLGDSYYVDKKLIVAKLSRKSPEDGALAERFQALTGWKLSFDKDASSLEAASQAQGEPQEDCFLPEAKGSLNQNEAIARTKNMFKGGDILPSRVSLKRDQTGPYLEVSFISPALGRRVADTLQKCADLTGYRIKLSPSINQNQLVVIASQLCSTYEISLLKNPSYMTATQSVALKLPPGAELPPALQEEFFTLTGVKLYQA